MGVMHLSAKFSDDHQQVERGKDDFRTFRKSIFLPTSCFQTSSLQNPEILNFYCYKSPCLRYFIAATQENKTNKKLTLVHYRDLNSRLYSDFTTFSTNVLLLLQKPIQDITLYLDTAFLPSLPLDSGIFQASLGFQNFKKYSSAFVSVLQL